MSGEWVKLAGNSGTPQRAQVIPDRGLFEDEPIGSGIVSRPLPEKSRVDKMWRWDNSHS